jgi:AraC family transcriptional regulator
VPALNWAMVQPLYSSLFTTPPSLQPGMQRREVLFSSELYTIADFSSHYTQRKHIGSGYTGEFCINFPRQGYYLFQSLKREHEEYNSQVLIEKPGCEFKLTQQVPGTGSCTMFLFTETIYKAITEQYQLQDYSFFSNENIFSLLLKASPEAEYLHHRILQQVLYQETPQLETDRLVMEMVDAVMKLLSIPSITPLPENYKKHHLTTIERAKEYLFENFTNDISLLELSRYCFVSVFHFSRLFKQFTGYSPYQYLRQVRLRHAAQLIRTTNLPVTDICFQSGFNRLDHFSSAFGREYGVAPSKYKTFLK